MRFVPVSCLREGLVLGKTLYGRNNELILSQGKLLNKYLIDGIKKLGYSGVYIDDDISHDVEIVNVISERLRLETTKGVKRLFMLADTSKSHAALRKELTNHVDNIVDELLSNKSIMINMIDLKCFDNYTYAHSVNVAVLSIVIGISLGLNRDSLARLGLGSIMHDIGKVFVNKTILNKPGKLTDDEYREVKNHPFLGYKYVKDKYKLPSSSYDAIIDHHEKFDGSGYPNYKSGEDISLFGRIVAIADVFDALSSARPYRSAMNPSEALEYIMGGSGSSFDSELVDAFVHKIAPYPVGSTVRLSNGYTGLVIENYEAVCLRPKIRVFKIGDEQVIPFEINLKDDYNMLSVIIEDMISDDILC